MNDPSGALDVDGVSNGQAGPDPSPARSSSHAKWLMTVALVAGTEAGLRLVSVGDVAAVVEEVDVGEYEGERLEQNISDPAWLEHAVRRHEGVVESVLPHAAVVPMRCGSIFSTQGSLRRRDSSTGPWPTPSSKARVPPGLRNFGASFSRRVMMVRPSAFVIRSAVG